MQPKTLRFFQLHNPFYLLSALCMLLGCFGLVHSLGMASGHIETLLVLMGVVQAYEFLLTGLAWHLITTRRAERDGRMLLLLELVFSRRRNLSQCRVERRGRPHRSPGRIPDSSARGDQGPSHVPRSWTSPACKSSRLYGLSFHLGAVARGVHALGIRRTTHDRAAT